MIFYLLIALLVLFFLAMGIDSYFFDGKYLVRANTTSFELKKSLELVLSQEGKNIKEWNVIPQDWISDKMNIPLKDAKLDEIRKSIVCAIGDSNTFETLNSESKKAIQLAIEKLS